MPKGEQIEIAGLPAPQLPEPTEDSVGGLVALAIREKVPVEVLERLVALKERVDARDARATFFAAVAAVQAEVGAIPKSAAIEVDRNGAKQVRSRYAPLDVITAKLREPLQKHGLFYRWDSKNDGEMVTITAILSHVDGHSESSSFSCRVKDAAAPGMSGVQVSGSAQTYGQRYSLISVLGLTTADEDDDGNGGRHPGETISEEQYQELTKVANEVQADVRGFCKFLGVESIRDIPAARFGEAKAALEQKRRRA